MPPSLTGRSPTCRISSTLTAATTSSCREVLGAGTARPPASPSTRTSMPPPIALHPVSVRATFSPTARFRRSGTRTARFTLPVPTMTGAYPSRCVSSPMRVSAFGDSSITRIICPSKGLPPWESTMSLAMRTSSSTTSITAQNSAPPLVTWNSPSDAPLRNTRKRKGRSLTTSPPANGVCILSTPESVTVSMVA